MQPVPTATHLDLILYSREQLVQEYRDMPEKGQKQVPALSFPCLHPLAALLACRDKHTISRIACALVVCVRACGGRRS